MVLERIQKENDIQKIAKEDLPVLAQEIREFLVEKISRTGGHLASNLGVVELTMAMHLCFHLPEDKIIWDVGHQSDTHKILTGRREGFDELRKYGGMSGFPKRKESQCDAFNTGHSSTSISAGLGYVEARDIRGEDYHVISVIGDGALTGGMAFEALNNASHLEKDFIVVLNDNQMSISQNVGGMSRYLDGIRTADAYTNLKKGLEKAIRKIPSGGDQILSHLRKTKSSIKQLFVPGMFFEDMGITYLGPVDGHNLKELIRAFREAKKVKGPVLLHVLTKKGKGYLPAEEEPSRFHGTEPFDIRSGKPLKKKEKDSYTDVFAKVMYDMGEKEPSLVAITAAMEDGTGLAPFHRKYRNRFFDVGIAEGHAVTFAAGLAAGGLKPEKGWTYETGVKKLIGDKSSLKFAVYHMDFDNKLGWSDKDPLTGLQHAINKGEFRNTGVEVEFARTVNAHWDYSLGLGYGNPEIRDPSKKNSKWEQDAGRIDIAAALTYRADKVRSTMTFKYLGDRECYSIYGDVPSRIRLTWNTIYDITPRDTVSLTLNNLLDHKNYANRYGHLALPFNWRLSYSHRF